MAWAFQTSPHDMHDWDSAQTPILFEATIKGKPRKLVSTAARNGYFFTLDRVTGEHILTTKYGEATNWAKSVDKNGSVRRNPIKDPTIPGRPDLADLRRHDQLGTARPTRRTRSCST